MTTSNTYEFGIETEAVDVVTEAFERCGKDPSSISATMLESARRSLMFMFTSWANDGPKLFDIYLHQIVMTEDTQSYALPTSTIYITDAYTHQEQNGQPVDLSITGISRTEYWGLPNKETTADRPSQFYFQRTITPLIYPWPVLQADADCTLYLNLMRMTQDVGIMSNTLDAPQRAFDAIAADLAWRLSGKYAPDRKEDLKVDRDESYALFNGEDRERVPLRIAPDVPGVFD